MNGRARRPADGTDHEADQDAGDARIRNRDQGRHRVGAGDPGRGVRRRRLPPDRGGDQHQRGARDRGKPLAPLHWRRHREIRVLGAGSGRRLRPAGGPDQPLRNETGGRQGASHPRRTTMTTFTIDTDNNITAHAAAPAAQDNVVAFATEKEFIKATAEWPIARFTEVWNAFAGVPPFGDLKPVKKFENRAKATARIWAAIQKREAAPAPQAAPKPTRKAKATKAAKTAADAPTPAPDASTPGVPREFSKKAIVRDLLSRTGGATLQEIMAATGWQKHTVRGFISTLTKKTRIAITSTRRESDQSRVYEAK